MAKISPPVMRAITGLELAAELYRRRMSDLGSVLTLSLTNPKKDSPALSLRIGINGDLMGGMKAPIEVGRKRMDIAYVNPTAMVAMAYRGIIERKVICDPPHPSQDKGEGARVRRTRIVNGAAIVAYNSGRKHRELSDRRPAHSKN